MAYNSKTFKADMEFDELVERVAQTDGNEVIQVSQEQMNDKTLDEFITRLEANINHDESGVEFWYARQLQEILEYGKWDNFKNVLEKAKIACENFGQQVNSHFAEVGKMVEGALHQCKYKTFNLLVTLAI